MRDHAHLSICHWRQVQWQENWFSLAQIWEYINMIWIWLHFHRNQNLLNILPLLLGKLRNVFGKSPWFGTDFTSCGCTVAMEYVKIHVRFMFENVIRSYQLSLCHIQSIKLNSLSRLTQQSGIQRDHFRYHNRLVKLERRQHSMSVMNPLHLEQNQL